MCIRDSINTIRNPIKIKAPSLSEDEKSKLDKLEEKVSLVLKQMKTDSETEDLYTNFQKFISREKHWCQWKENNCPVYERPPNAVLKDSLRDWLQKKEDLRQRRKDAVLESGLKGEDHFVCKLNEVAKDIIQKSVTSHRRFVGYDNTTDLFKNLDTAKIKMTAEPIDPRVGYYMDRIYMDLEDTSKAEEDKIKNDEVYVWKAFRVLCRHDLSIFGDTSDQNPTYNITNIDDIAKRLKKNYQPNEPVPGGALSNQGEGGPDGDAANGGQATVTNGVGKSTNAMASEEKNSTDSKPAETHTSVEKSEEEQTGQLKKPEESVSNPDLIRIEDETSPAANPPPPAPTPSENKTGNGKSKEGVASEDLLTGKKRSPEKALKGEKPPSKIQKRAQ
eukprot:TRINITY_DN4889_c0_g1_i5.p1 TRINITY_DN4889_c0_g1~~TRINITY_DN4889_c0_g1_i5.p1  ORF type:complete len:389 (+),score=101.84 TRINITY_DN4889_c0_g1_i5:78-1244(+)